MRVEGGSPGHTVKALGRGLGTCLQGSSGMGLEAQGYFQCRTFTMAVNSRIASPNAIRRNAVGDLTNQAAGSTGSHGCP